jgi:hypothetical protein
MRVGGLMRVGLGLGLGLGVGVRLGDGWRDRTTRSTPPPVNSESSSPPL